jgi:RimJ/RimL family protein N-acetyltransferase
VKLSQLTPAKLVMGIRRRLWSRRELCIYMCPGERVRMLPRPQRCERDRWGDLQCCAAWSFGNRTREEYLADLDERRQMPGTHLYSIVQDGVLVHSGWMAARQERAPDEELGLVFMPPPESAALWDYFTHPSARGRGLYRDSLWQCMHDAVEIEGARRVFIYVYSNNAISRHAIEKAGFEYYGSLILERRLFRARRYATSPHDSLDVRLLSGNRRAAIHPRPVSVAHG